MIFIKLILVFLFIVIFVIKILYSLFLSIEHKNMIFIKKFRFIYFYNNTKFKDFNDFMVYRIEKSKDNILYKRKQKIKKIVK